MSSVSLVPRKELASLFVAVDHARLSADAFPTVQMGQQLAREEIERFLETKGKALMEWRESIATHYRDAFERSHRVVNSDVERQNFRELKRIYQSGIGLQSFLKVLLEGQHEGNQEGGEKLKDLKKEHQRLTADSASLVATLAAQYDELNNALTEVQKAVHDISQLQPLDGILQQFHREQSELQEALSRAEQEHMQLTAEIGSHASRCSDLDHDIQQEMAECTLLRDLIGKRRQDVMSKTDERTRIREETECHLKEMEVITQLLKTIGGTEVLETTGNRLTLSIRTDTAPNGDQRDKRSFIHRLFVELHPTTFLVECARLEPDEGIDLDVVVDKGLKTAVASVRSLLFLSLNQSTHLEGLNSAFIRVDPKRGIWRVALSNDIEVEFSLPIDWPYDKEAEVKLLDIQSATPSINLANVRDKMRSVPFKDPQAMLDAILHAIRERGHL